ncbi:MAG: hypothetical protein AAGC60_30605 [Acidobacteriota bacterium]
MKPTSFDLQSVLRRCAFPVGSRILAGLAVGALGALVLVPVSEGAAANATAETAPGDGSSAAAAEELTPAAAALERMKTLEGSWEGTTGRGKPATLVVRVVAGGTAVMEEYSEGAGTMGMMTLYHLDGEDLMLTHYCISNNQPRMRADLAKSEDGALYFEFFDSTNLQDPMAGHMRRARIQIVDENTLSNAWTYRQGGEDVFTEAIEWQRAGVSR